jgi:flagellar biosynthesis protein FlhB
MLLAVVCGITALKQFDIFIQKSRKNNNTADRNFNVMVASAILALILLLPVIANIDDYFPKKNNLKQLPMKESDAKEPSKAIQAMGHFPAKVLLQNQRTCT